jgi:hypothetical protein
MSLCYPEEMIVVNFPAHMKAELIGKNGQNHQLLETSSGAVVVFRDENVAEIRGNSVAVVMAQSAIEEQIRWYNARLEETSSSPEQRDRELDHRVRRGGSPATTREYQLSQEMRNQSYGIVESGNPSLQNADASDQGRSRKISPPTTIHTSAVAADPNIMGFSKRLGYSEQDVIRVIERLGPEASRNAVLDTLLKFAGGGSQLKQQPENNSVAQVQRSSSTKPGLRPIVIDGSNVAMRHGNNEVFSCRGIGLCVDYFLQRGHRQITVFVPSWRKEKSSPDHPINNQEVLYALEKDKYLVFTPSRKVQGKRIVCYDDRFIVRLAAETSGVIVSNDTYQDLLKDDCQQQWKEVIERRLLMYTFVGDIFMVPDDPLGRKGPNLEDFLRHEPLVATPAVSVPSIRSVGNVDYRNTVCPYLGKCTYGNKCKYKHPDREQQQQQQQTSAPDHPLYAPPVSTTVLSSSTSTPRYLGPADSDTTQRSYKRPHLPEVSRLSEGDLLGRGGFAEEHVRDYPVNRYRQDEHRDHQITSRGGFQAPEPSHRTYRTVEHPVQRYQAEDHLRGHYQQAHPPRGVHQPSESSTVYRSERSQGGYRSELTTRGKDTRMMYPSEPAYRPQYEPPTSYDDHQFGDYSGRQSAPNRVQHGYSRSDPYYHEHGSRFQGEYSGRGVTNHVGQYTHYPPGGYYQPMHRSVSQGPGPGPDIHHHGFSHMSIHDGHGSGRSGHVTEQILREAVSVFPNYEQQFREALSRYPYINSVNGLLSVVEDNAVPL